MCFSVGLRRVLRLVMAIRSHDLSSLPLLVLGAGSVGRSGKSSDDVAIGIGGEVDDSVGVEFDLDRYQYWCYHCYWCWC